MKTVVALCLYARNADGYTVENLQVTSSKNGFIPLTTTNKTFKTFDCLYKALLTLLANNNMKVRYFDSAGARFYNIAFMEIHNPTQINTYGLTHVFPKI